MGIYRVDMDQQRRIREALKESQELLTRLFVIFRRIEAALGERRPEPVYKRPGGIKLVWRRPEDPRDQG